MLKVGADGDRTKRKRVWLLKDDRHHVVANVALPRQLLLVVGRKRQHGGDVEHHLVRVVLGVDAIFAGGVAARVKAALVRVKVAQSNPCAEKVKELVERRRGMLYENQLAKSFH